METGGTPVLRSKHFPGGGVPLVNVGLGEPGAVPLLGVFEPGARGADIIMLGENSPEGRVDDEGLNFRRAVSRKINLFEEDDKVVGIPGDEHFVKGIAINVLPHPQEVGAFEAVFQAVRLEFKAVAKTREGCFSLGKDKKEIVSGFDLLVHGSFPIGAFDADGL